jgi:iron complex outermembrane receptor protein
MTINKLFYLVSCFLPIDFGATGYYFIARSKKFHDSPTKKFSNTQSVQQLNDSIITKNQASLTSL